MSALGSEFTGSTFLRTPTKVIRRALAIVEDEEQRRANIDSLSSAHIAQIVIAVAHGFSGSKGRPPKTKTKDFLPFPAWSPASVGDEGGPDESTRFVLIQLINQALLPPHVFTALIIRPEGGR